MRVRFQFGVVSDPSTAAQRLIAALHELKAWDETKHRRHPRGSRQGGRFAPKLGGAAPVDVSHHATSASASRSAASPVPTMEGSQQPATGAARQGAPAGGKDYYDARWEEGYPALADLRQATWQGLGRNGSPDRPISRIWKLVTADGRRWFAKRMHHRRRQAFQEEMAWRVGKALGLPVLPAINYDVRQVDDGPDLTPQALRFFDPDRQLSQWLTVSPLIEATDATRLRMGTTDGAAARLDRLDESSLRWALGGGQAAADPYYAESSKIKHRIQKGKVITVYRPSVENGIPEGAYVSENREYALAYGEQHLAGQPWSLQERDVRPNELVVRAPHEFVYAPDSQIAPLGSAARAGPGSQVTSPAAAALAKVSTDMRIRLWLYDFVIANTDRHDGNWMLAGTDTVPTGDEDIDDRVRLLDHGYSFGQGTYDRLKENAFFKVKDAHFDDDTPIDNRYLRWLEEGLAAVDADVDRLSQAFAEESADRRRFPPNEVQQWLDTQGRSFRSTLDLQMGKLRRAFAERGQGPQQATTLGALWRSLGLI